MSLYDATTYLPDAVRLTNKEGCQMVGEPCPSCGSPLVIRERRSDQKKFVACDKTNKRRCAFSIGMYETLWQRTKRINKELMEESHGRMHDAALASIPDSF